MGDKKCKGKKRCRIPHREREISAVGAGGAPVTAMISGVTSFDLNLTYVPEPASLMILAAGFVFLSTRLRRV